MLLRSIVILLCFSAALTSLVHADFPVRQTSNWAFAPVAAYNSMDHQYLVVWPELVFPGTIPIPQIMAQRIAEDGTILGSAFMIFQYGMNEAVAYNSSANEYLVAFNPGNGFVGQRVSASGNLLGGPTALMDSVSNARLLFNSLTNEYLFLGAMLVDNPALGSGYKIIKIKSRKIGADGQALNAPVLVEFRPHGYQPAEPNFGAAFAPIQSSETPNGRYLVVIGHTTALKMLDSDGAPMNIVRDPDHPGVTYQYLPFKTGSTVGGEFGVDVAYGTSSSYSMTGPAFLVVWADNNNSFGGYGWAGIYGGFVDALKTDYLTTDVIQDHSFPISFEWDLWAQDPYAETWRPKVDFNYSSQKFYVVWRETPGTNANNDTKVNHIRGADVFERIPSSPADNVIISATGGSEDPKYPALASSTTSEHALVVWQDYRDKGSSSANIYGSVQKVADPVPPPPPPPPTTTWVVTNTNDAGAGSLRQAILNANARVGLDTIAFNIPGTGVHTIQPVIPLPVIADPVLIDGYSQPGSSVNSASLKDPDNAVLTVMIDGTATISNPAANVGLEIAGGSSCVRGLVINSFTASGVLLEGKGGNVVEGCYLGTDNKGLVRRDNWIGVTIDSISNNRVGGTSAAARNIISGNKLIGVLITRSGATGNLVQGNYIGVDASGQKSLGNIYYGAEINAASSNLIGGTDPGAGNVIGGSGSNTQGSEVLGAGIDIRHGATNNVIAGNLIGTNASGDGSLANYGQGIYLEAGGNTIGGPVPGARNVVSGNSYSGILITTDNNTVQGNFIGTDITGTKAVPNYYGLQVAQGSGNLIGGLVPSAGNTISGNGNMGVLLLGASNNTLRGNLIGTRHDAISPLGNMGFGVLIVGGPSNNSLGGSVDGAGNTIAFNGSEGLHIEGNGTGNQISRNSIYANNGIGINLVGGVEDANGVTANDPGDADTGPNGLQNYPVLTFGMGGDYLWLKGTLNSQSNTTYRLEFFSTPKDSSVTGHDGKNYLGWIDLTTDGNGDASFDATIGYPVGLGQLITATATDPNGNSSEFSAPLEITLIPRTEVVTNTLDSGPGSLRQAILNANSKPGRDSITFTIPGSGQHTITPLTSLPEITDPVVIDGYTQPGSSVNTNSLGGSCNAVLMVVLSGSQMTGYGDGLNITGGGSRIRGLAIQTFPSAISLVKKGGNVVEGNYLSGGFDGVRIDSSASNTIGGTTPEARNVVGNNEYFGVAIQHPASRWNLVQGNYIGVDATGTHPLPNGMGGVFIYNASSNTIGGTTAEAGNVIAGYASTGTPINNTRSVGIQISDNSSGNRVVGNLIGTNATGDDLLPNGGKGILLEGQGNTIGGTSVAARNIVSGNTLGGIEITGDSNYVLGNYIGTDVAGVKALGNRAGGIIIRGTKNHIGGLSPFSGNLISANVPAGIVIDSTGTGNYTRQNVVQGNRIGTQQDGASPLGNSGPGVLVRGWALDDTIGGTADGAANVIAFNSTNGVRVIGDNGGTAVLPMGIHISRNSIFENGQLGIDLVGGVEDGDGVTANDIKDGDIGPNNFQNCPELASAQGGGSLTVQGRLNSVPNAVFALEFFATPVAGSLAPGEGQTYVGSTSVKTDANGDVSFSAEFSVPVSAGRAITVTATDTAGNTSEFSAPLVTVTGVSGNPESTLPRETALLQNYPNPFNPKTGIRYQVSGISDVKLMVYDILGRTVAVLVNERKAPGRYEVSFDGSGLASGVYIYRLTAGNFVSTKTMLLVK